MVHHYTTSTCYQPFTSHLLPATPCYKLTSCWLRLLNKELLLKVVIVLSAQYPVVLSSESSWHWDENYPVLMRNNCGPHPGRMADSVLGRERERDVMTHWLSCDTLTHADCWLLSLTHPRSDNTREILGWTGLGNSRKQRSTRQAMSYQFQAFLAEVTTHCTAP